MQPSAGGLVDEQPYRLAGGIDVGHDLPAPQLVLRYCRLLRSEHRSDPERAKDRPSGQVGAGALNVDVDGLAVQVGQCLDGFAGADMHVVVVQLADVLHL